MAQLMEPELRNKRFATNNILQQWLCGSVGRAVASDTRGPWFEFSHQQIHKEHLFSANYFEKTKIKKMRPCLAHLKKLNMELMIERFDKINTPNE